MAPPNLMSSRWPIPRGRGVLASLSSSPTPLPKPFSPQSSSMSDHLILQERRVLSSSLSSDSLSLAPPLALAYNQHPLGLGELAFDPRGEVKEGLRTCFAILLFPG